MLLYLMFLMDSKAPNYATILSSAHFICQFGNCYSGKADSILYMFSNGNFEFGKNLRVSATKSLETTN